MVGDSIDDMAAGRRAGAATVLLVNGVNGGLAAHEYTDLVIERLDDLVAILEDGFEGRDASQRRRDGAGGKDGHLADEPTNLRIHFRTDRKKYGSILGSLLAIPTPELLKLKSQILAYSACTILSLMATLPNSQFRRNLEHKTHHERTTSNGQNSLLFFVFFFFFFFSKHDG
ncbi:hypothetical protein H633G_10950 [Metarhizium anisopliae BRIP 53284]|nr:hypothetical protein H633G_10950 [Metarhizium anisopliae BRIP 53284]